MNIRNRVAIIILICLPCVGCDQVTKLLASEYLSKDVMDSYFYDLLRLGYTENIGAFLGMGSQLQDQYRFLIFTVFVGCFLTGFLIYMIFSSKQTFISLFALSLMFAGGSSNFFDRAVNDGAVIDFLNIGIGSFRTGIFNVADIAILAGCLIFFFSQWHVNEKTDF